MDDIPQLEAEVKELRRKVEQALDHKKRMEQEGVKQSHYVDLSSRISKSLREKETKLEKLKKHEANLRRTGRYKEVSKKFDAKRAELDNQKRAPSWLRFFIRLCLLGLAVGVGYLVYSYLKERGFSVDDLKYPFNR